MKRYLLFKGYEYYPSGGWLDFAGTFDTIAEAKTNAKNCDWWHIVDSKNGQTVEDNAYDGIDER